MSYRLRASVGLALPLATFFFSGPAFADLTPRQTFDLRGDIVLVGGTLGHDCRASTPAPLVGTVDADCGLETADSALDVFWRSQDPTDATASAKLATKAADARTTVRLGLPANAKVRYARLYWGSRGAGIDGAVTLDRPGTNATVAVTADSTSLVASEQPQWAQATADVTAFVAAQGAGLFRFSNFDFEDVRNKNEQTAFAGWSLMVVYEDDAAPNRNIALFDGLDLVRNGKAVSGTITGFRVPKAGFDAKLAVVAYEGDVGGTGDALQFNGVALSDAQNPSDNFFNGSRSILGRTASDGALASYLQNTGDLPRLSGAPGSNLGVDLDIVDITSRVKADETSATFSLTTGADALADKYAVGAFATSISTLRPDLSGIKKSVAREGGGTTIRPGDTVVYTITVPNGGNDNAIDTVIADPLPKGVTFVPGSIAIGGKSFTDAAGDDAGEFNASSRTVTARIGLGATAAKGGLVCGATIADCPAGGATAATVTFRATVDATAKGTIDNQATVAATGEKGDGRRTYTSDADPTTDGAQATRFTVDETPAEADAGPVEEDAGPAVDAGVVDDGTEMAGGALSCATSPAAGGLGAAAAGFFAAVVALYTRRRATK